MKQFKIIAWLTLVLLLGLNPAWSQSKQSSRDLFLSGTIEQINLKEQYLQIDGVRYQFSEETTAVTRNSKNSAAFQLQVGDRVTGSFRIDEGPKRTVVSIDARGASS